MPTSYACLYYHIVFSTRDRLPLITPEIRPRLHEYLGGIVRTRQGALVAAGGTADHVHLLVSLSKTRTIAADVQAMKASSSGWLHASVPRLAQFAWQEGYGAFSISYSGLPRVKAYLAQQEEHHRTVSFQEELVAFLQQHQVRYDERYLWD